MKREARIRRPGPPSERWLLSVAACPPPLPATSRSPYALPSAAVTATAVLGGIGTATGTRWYRRRDKPPWQPPASAFGPVWTALYVLLALAGGRSLAGSGGPARRAYLRAYLANLALNTGWTWIFVMIPTSFTAR